MSENVFYLDNDKVIQKDIETPSDATGEYVPAAGLAGITVSVSLTKGGAFIAAFTGLGMTERGAMPGRYSVVVDGVAIRAELAGRVDQSVYVCFTLPGDLRVWEEYTVREFRP